MTESFTFDHALAGTTASGVVARSNQLNDVLKDLLIAGGVFSSETESVIIPEFDSQVKAWSAEVGQMANILERAGGVLNLNSENIQDAERLSQNAMRRSQ